MKNLKIDYPCQWVYTVIGADETALRLAIRGVFGGRGHHLSFSKSSKNGKYVSLNVSADVSTEDERDKIHPRQAPFNQ